MIIIGSSKGWWVGVGNTKIYQELTFLLRRFSFQKFKVAVLLTGPARGYVIDQFKKKIKYRHICLDDYQKIDFTQFGLYCNL